MFQPSSIVGQDRGLRAVLERVAMVAPRDLPVLLFGETGTGKELVARAIHDQSPRAGEPFLRVNCGALAPELVDSELFGHERGAFTGAHALRKGWFEQAHRGTLFLDEIGELPLSVQVRLLRVAQEGELMRVGSAQTLRVDVRLVAATHRDLAAMVEAKTFREDLYYRLAVFPIVIPPLRERAGDLPELARHFAARAATRFGLRPCAPTAADLELLRRYRWPGNIRELASVIDRAALLGDGHGLDVARALGTPRPTPPRAEPTNAPVTLDDAIRAHLRAALAATHGRIEGPFGAARRLAVNPHTLRAKLRKLGIDARRYRAGDEIEDG